jgi:hypothetical protein
MNVVDTPRAHLVDSTCPMCNTTFWCSTFKQQHLDSTTCGAKLLLLQNMLPPMHAAPLLPYPVPMQSGYFCSCPECVRPPLPPPVAPEQAMPPTQTPTCNMCGSTFADMGTLGFHVGVVHVGMGQSYAAGIC